MSGRNFTVLGTSSAVPTKLRSHNGYVLRWDEQLIMFDPGEGTQRQCSLAGVSVSKLTGVFITHFHGDHCLGLPGVVQRRTHDNVNNPPPHKPLPIYYPGEGQEYYDRLVRASIFADASERVSMPITESGPLEPLGKLSVTALPLEHRCATFGYRIEEPESVNLDKEKLDYYGIDSSASAELKSVGHVEVNDRRVELEEVSTKRPGQSVAFVMDTAPCNNAVELARGVDLLVCESTYMESEQDLADTHKHMTARAAGELAAKAGAKQLLLTHFSSRYDHVEELGDEARRFHNSVHAAKDLDSISFHRSNPGLITRQGV